MKAKFDPNYEVDDNDFQPVILLYFDKNDDSFQNLKYQVETANGEKKPDKFFRLSCYELVKNQKHQESGLSEDEYRIVMECYESEVVQNFIKEKKIYLFKNDEELFEAHPEYREEQPEPEFCFSEEEFYRLNL